LCRSSVPVSYYVRNRPRLVAESRVHTLGVFGGGNIRLCKRNIARESAIGSPRIGAVIGCSGCERGVGIVIDDLVRAYVIGSISSGISEGEFEQGAIDGGACRNGARVPLHKNGVRACIDGPGVRIELGLGAVVIGVDIEVSIGGERERDRSAATGCDRHRYAPIRRAPRSGTGERIGDGTRWGDALGATTYGFTSGKGATGCGATRGIGDGAPGERRRRAARDTCWVCGESEDGGGSGRLSGCTHHITPAGEIAGGIDGSHVVVVEGIGGETGVDEGRRCWSADLSEIGTTRALAAFDDVAGDAHVVCRRIPCDRDARGARGICCEVEVCGEDGRGGVATGTRTSISYLKIINPHCLCDGRSVSNPGTEDELVESHIGLRSRSKDRIGTFKDHAVIEPNTKNAVSLTDAVIDRV